MVMGEAYLWTMPEAFGAEPLPEQRPGGEPDLVGYKVVANDGEIGHVDLASHEAGRACVVVDTGGWLPGRRSVIPARAMRDVNHESGTIQVDLTKDEIREAPEFDEERGADAYRETAGSYFGGLGRFGSHP